MSVLHTCLLFIFVTAGLLAGLYAGVCSMYRRMVEAEKHDAYLSETDIMQMDDPSKSRLHNKLDRIFNRASDTQINRSDLGRQEDGYNFLSRFFRKK